MNHETAQAYLERAPWRKSSYSQGQSDCVQVANATEWVAVRDSKSSGPTLVFATSQWRAFLRSCTY